MTSCAIIASGDELVTGAVRDENSAWISARLLELGLPTVLHLTVGDDLERIIDALRLAGERAPYVIVTGGLGPTEDDLTRDAFCRFAGVPLLQNEAAAARLRAVFATLGRTMTPNNLKQACIPEGAALIENALGTAPGFYMAAHGAVYYFLPGVPRECRAMMDTVVLPLLGRTVRGRVFKHLLLRTFGWTESQLDERLKTVSLPAGVRLGYRAIFPEIHLKLTADGETGEKAEERLAEAAAAVRAAVGAVIYSEDGRPLEQVVLDLCRERRLSLALAESCTGGLIAKRLTDIPGSSDVLERGFVVYSNQAKIQLLGVPAELLVEHGAVSEAVARAMAAGARERAGTDLALAVTGIAGPGGGTPDKPVGTVYIALADRTTVWANRFFFASWNRLFVRELTAQAALEFLRHYLLGEQELPRR